MLNLAKTDITVKRVFLDRSSYARTSAAEAPLYHERNVVAYPQKLDAALTTLGMSPQLLAETLTVQFVGGDRQRLRREPELSVSVKKEA